jgi:hypothetical protein
LRNGAASLARGAAVAPSAERPLWSDPAHCPQSGRTSIAPIEASG